MTRAVAISIKAMSPVFIGYPLGFGVEKNFLTQILFLHGIDA
jgi:hypothetical protein